jgi:hypothetical protein
VRSERGPWRSRLSFSICSFKWAISAWSSEALALAELSLSLGETAELRTLEALRSGLPSAYTVFHSVHWSRDAAYQTTFGEADFIVVNQSGEVVVIEQKSGALDESADGLIKRYSDRRKNVATQVHRTLDGIRDQFKRQSGHNIVLDYLIYCPDYRLRDLNAVRLNVSRIVDSRDASSLADRITREGNSAAERLTNV